MEKRAKTSMVSKHVAFKQMPSQDREPETQSWSPAKSGS